MTLSDLGPWNLSETKKQCQSFLPKYELLQRIRVEQDSLLLEVAKISDLSLGVAGPCQRQVVR